jgi:competence protein ComEC
MKFFKIQKITIVAIVACISSIFVWFYILVPQPQVLSVSFLNVGQGDSILIQGPTGITMLVDGGPDRSVLRELPKKLPFFKRTVDLIVETHPDKDHISGLIDVFKRYRVSYILSPGIKGETLTSRNLADSIAQEEGIHSFLARRGQRIHLGDGAYADVLYPDQDASTGPTNDGSIVLHVVYGTTSFMLTGDLPSTKEDYLVGLESAEGAIDKNLKSDVLKAGHHGSKFSSDDAWLKAVHPRIVVISAGKGNTYGHPAPDALARIKNEGATVLSTIDSGTITFTSDGKTISRK